MTPRRHWKLGAKLALLAAPFLLLMLLSVALAMWVSWRVESAGAAPNDWTALLHVLHLAAMALAIGGAVVLIVAVHRFVLEPIGALNDAIRGIEGGDLTTRSNAFSSDEFDSLSEGFDGMAAHLQSVYRHLEARVSEKTAELEDKRERLEALYDVTALVAGAANLDELARGFAQRVGRVARADGVALRWSDEANERYLMLAAEGLPAWMSDAERCIVSGDCHCGAPQAASGVRVIPLQRDPPESALRCSKAGFQTLVSVPIRLKRRVMGEVDLFFHAQVGFSDAERSLLEALTAHLAGAMENMRLNALEKEAAVSQERSLLARELHDSIAQSLAFLKIQVQLMRDAFGSGDAGRMREALDEIDVGVRESYGDVRELLLHFRTRTNAEDIEPALQTTLRKFEHQSGVETELRMQGHGLPLAPDLQLQVLHIVQEALSNVRKHAQATHVWLEVQQHPQWRFEVRDDGTGFTVEAAPHDETHVGLSIMAERAERIGAAVEVFAIPGRGTSVVLTLPAGERHSAAAAPVRTEVEADAAAVRVPVDAAVDVMATRAPLDEAVLH